MSGLGKPSLFEVEIVFDGAHGGGPNHAPSAELVQPVSLNRPVQPGSLVDLPARRPDQAPWR
jgi:hypothetical protein